MEKKRLIFCLAKGRILIAADILYRILFQQYWTGVVDGKPALVLLFQPIARTVGNFVRQVNLVSDTPGESFFRLEIHQVGTVIAKGETTINRSQVAEISYRSFWQDLLSLQAE